MRKLPNKIKSKLILLECVMLVQCSYTRSKLHHFGNTTSCMHELTVSAGLQNSMRPVDLASVAGYSHIVEYLTSIDTTAQVGKLRQYAKYL